LLNYYFKDTVQSFLQKSTEEIIGEITLSNTFDSSFNQNKSWESQIPILKDAVSGLKGTIFFEFSIPRMGKRVDVIIVTENIVFVIEFKVGETKYHRHHIEQVWDYALDLKNFHDPSHNAVLVPILVATENEVSFLEIVTTPHNDNVIFPIRTNKDELYQAISNVFSFFKENNEINGELFSRGRYSPTPTIIEAAVSLYNSHTVDEITRSDAEAKNLTVTTTAISDIINNSKSNTKKSGSSYEFVGRKVI